MNINEYQDLTKETELYSGASKGFIEEIAIDACNNDGEVTDPEYEKTLSLMYCTGKINGEAGELSEEIFKAFREGGMSKERRDKAFYELGDICWYVARIADLLGYSLEEVMAENIKKLMDRKNREVLHGDGNKR